MCACKMRNPGTSESPRNCLSSWKGGAAPYAGAASILCAYLETTGSICPYSVLARIIMGISSCGKGAQHCNADIPQSTPGSVLSELRQFLAIRWMPHSTHQIFAWIHSLIEPSTLAWTTRGLQAASRGQNIHHLPLMT